MSKNRTNRTILQEIIITSGFLGGLWIYAGVNPYTEVLKAFTDLVPKMSTLFFWVIVIILTAVPLVATYRIGRWWGISAVFLAFLGGIFIESWGVWSLIAGYLIGLYAPVSRRKIH